MWTVEMKLRRVAEVLLSGRTLHVVLASRAANPALNGHGSMVSWGHKHAVSAGQRPPAVLPSPATHAIWHN